MTIVVDTNIVFSSILSPKGLISDLLLNSDEHFDFFSPNSILEELNNHRQKLIGISGYTDSELSFLLGLVLKKVELISLEAIKPKTWELALELTKNVDEFDTPFIALCLEMSSPLWTGDKKLRNGLKSKGIDWILESKDLNSIRETYNS